MASTSGLSILEISAIFLSITALLSYVNHRFIGLPTTIGVMVISILLSIFAIFLGFLGFGYCALLCGLVLVYCVLGFGVADLWF